MGSLKLLERLELMVTFWAGLTVWHTKEGQ